MKVLVGVVLLVAAIGPMSSTDDALWLARAVQGEAGVMGDQREEAGVWVVHVALNRAASPWFSNNIAVVVQEGFWGAYGVDEPDEWAWTVVKDALRVKDPTGGSLFIFSDEDVSAYVVDWTSCQGSLKRDGWRYSVHTFARWPFIVAKSELQENENDSSRCSKGFCK